MPEKFELYLGKYTKFFKKVLLESDHCSSFYVIIYDIVDTIIIININIINNMVSSSIINIIII